MNKLNTYILTPVLLLTALASAPARALETSGNLTTWIATDQVKIGNSFTGKSILVLGRFSKPGQIIVKLTSPEQPAAMNHKVRRGIFWLGSGKISIKGTPGVLQILASSPPETQLDRASLEKYGLTLEGIFQHATFEPQPEKLDGWKKAFLRLKEAKQDYLSRNDGVKLIRGEYFSTYLMLPAAIPMGNYRLDIYLTRNGSVVATSSHTISVHEVNTERWMTQFTAEHGWLFGSLFVPFMAILGLSIGLFLRRITS